MYTRCPSTFTLPLYQSDESGNFLALLNRVFIRSMPYMAVNLYLVARPYTDSLHDFQRFY